MSTLPPTYDDDDISTEPFTNLPVTKGLRRYPVKFVAASSSEPQAEPESTAPKPLSFAEQYLAIVFPNGVPKDPEVTGPICPICKEAITEKDEAEHNRSIGHRLSLPRAKFPSSIDRTRMGLKYLEKYGFDVDSEKGLGADGEGILHPIVVKEKHDTHGLGLQVDKKSTVEKLKESGDAAKMRKKAVEDKKKAEKLQRMFYGDDDVEKYLEELESQKQPGSSGGGLDLGAFKVTKRRKR
jgi:hypothetical protein